MLAVLDMPNRLMQVSKDIQALDRMLAAINRQYPVSNSPCADEQQFFTTAEAATLLVVCTF